MAEEVKTKTAGTPKKEVSTYVKYPLILGIVCLVCGGVLGLVNMFTEPRIESIELKKANAALGDIMSANKIDFISDPFPEEVPWEEGQEHKNLDVRRKINTASGDVYYYYQATTDKGYSGVVTFGAVVEVKNFTIIGTEYIKGDEDSIGQNAAKGMSYSVSNPFKSGDTIVSGSTAKMTLPKVQDCLEAIITDASELAK